MKQETSRMLRRSPFRGIYSEIAQELKVSRQAVQQQARKGHADTLARIAEKIQQRKRRPR